MARGAQADPLAQDNYYYDLGLIPSSICPYQTPPNSQLSNSGSIASSFNSSPDLSHFAFGTSSDPTSSIYPYSVNDLCDLVAARDPVAHSSPYKPTYQQIGIVVPRLPNGSSTPVKSRSSKHSKDPNSARGHVNTNKKESPRSSGPAESFNDSNSNGSDPASYPAPKGRSGSTPTNPEVPNQSVVPRPPNTSQIPNQPTLPMPFMQFPGYPNQFFGPNVYFNPFRPMVPNFGQPCQVPSNAGPIKVGLKPAAPETKGRSKFSPTQVAIFRKYFDAPGSHDKENIAREAGVTKDQVNDWFKTERKRRKRAAAKSNADARATAP